MDLRSNLGAVLLIDWRGGFGVKFGVKPGAMLGADFSSAGELYERLGGSSGTGAGI